MSETKQILPSFRWVRVMLPANPLAFHAASFAFTAIFKSDMKFFLCSQLSFFDGNGLFVRQKETFNF